jgi:steroid delta-isomerase-like uncharacterized protein
MGTGKDLWNEFDRLSNEHDWTGVASLYANDGAYCGPGWCEEGPEAIKAYLEGAYRAFPDQTFPVLRVVEEDDSVVAEWIFRCTHTGPMTLPDGTEIPPTGKKVELPVVSVCQITDGKFARLTDYFDNAAFMTQLGLMPGT